jgi:transmembrane sensor
MTDMFSSSFMDVEKQAAIWLADRDRDDWTAEDQARLDGWLAQSPAHEIAYWRLETAWARTERLAALRRPAQMSSDNAPARRSVLARIAVAIGLVAVAGLLAGSYFSRGKEQIFATGIGGHKRVMLADGSLVELNTDTVLRIVSGGTTRKAFLDRGEAYFKIAHDANRPFVVFAGDHRVIDVGTAFVVRRDPQRLEVTLLEGRARFESLGSAASKAVDLTPGDEIVATTDRTAHAHKPLAALANDLGWRHDVLVFDGTTLADAAAEFNRYSRVKLVIADTKVARLTINGTFRTNNLQAFVDATQVVLGINVTTHKDEIVISK